MVNYCALNSVMLIFEMFFSDLLSELQHIYIRDKDILLHAYFQRVSSENLLQLRQTHIENKDISLLYVYSPHVSSEYLLQLRQTHIEGKDI